MKLATSFNSKEPFLSIILDWKKSLSKGILNPASLLNNSELSESLVILIDRMNPSKDLVPNKVPVFTCWLEYRGYDSAGIVLEDKNNNFEVKKTKGKVSDLVDISENLKGTSHIGMGHTRWATHGVPSDRNSHPPLAAYSHSASVGNLNFVGASPLFLPDFT